MFTALEVCAGGGGQALGLHQAGFSARALVEIDKHACQTLGANNPHWNVINKDLREFDASPYIGVDLLAGGVPCPPFSIAGQQLGENDERDLFPTALRLAEECDPKVVMLENVKGLASARFATYRQKIIDHLNNMGYIVFWRMVFAENFGVPQLRPRFVLVALKEEFAPFFSFPSGDPDNKIFVGDALYDLMAEDGWCGADDWRDNAMGIAPTLVGGSKKHGGADLGPTRARNKWLELGVNGKGIADSIPDSSHPLSHTPKLTIRMVARIQGFPDDWNFKGGKTSQYRQIGNAFPPPVAQAFGEAIISALNKEECVNPSPIEHQISLVMRGVAA